MNPLLNQGMNVNVNFFLVSQFLEFIKHLLELFGIELVAKFTMVA